MVIKTPQEFLQAALTNNSFNIDDTDRALRMALDHSFSYLYRLQRNMAIYEEYHYTTRNVVEDRDYGDFYLDSRERVLVNYPVALIPPYAREKFRMSEYYGTVVPYQTLIEKDKIFTRLPVITIDDQVVKDFGVEVYDDHITVHLGFDRYFMYSRKFDSGKWEYRFIEHRHSVQLIDNAGVSDLVTNSGMLKRNSYSGNGFDRLLKTYLTDSKVKLRPASEGIYMVTAYIGDDRLGSNIMEAEWDNNGDVFIHFPDEIFAALNETTKPVTLRFYMYRGLRKAKSFDKNQYPLSKMIKSYEIDGKGVSDFFTVYTDDGKLHAHPVPTENFLVFKEKGYTYFSGEPTLSHVPNANLEIRYPNKYRFVKDVSSGDRYKIFYFYMHPYELQYEDMYWFFPRYLIYRWEDLSYDAILSIVSNGNLSIIQDINGSINEKYIDLYHLAAAYHVKRLNAAGEVPDNLMGDMYEHLTRRTLYQMNFEQRKIEFLQGIEDRIPTEAIIPDEVDRFAEVYEFLVDKPITDYFYDEIDYVRNYADENHPFEYKVNKLKSFIADDLLHLKNYVKIQNKVAMKYEYATKDIDLTTRYCTARENGQNFREAMYMFPIKKTDPDAPVTARVWVDGLLCATFVLDRHPYVDVFYIPSHYVTADSYIEIEVFHYYDATATEVFTAEKPYVELDFPAAEYAIPTMNDIFFHLKDSELETDRIDKKKFTMEVVSDRYNYMVNDTPIQIFYRKCRHGEMEKGPYYDGEGHYYSYDGQPDHSKDIGVAGLNNLRVIGEVTESTGYLTDNHLNIVKLEDIVNYQRMYNGATTLEEDKKGVLHSDISRVKITLTDPELYDKEICISIAKRPFYSGAKVQSIAYPSFSKLIPNWEDVGEYARVFKNGRLRARNRYEFSDYFEGMMTIQMLDRLEKGDTVAFDITPFRNKLVYFKETLDSDCVDLRGYINKPFDHSYYEVYLNGRRLNKTNIFPISPWEFRLGGVHSAKNLEIYEKDRDWEYYGVDFTNYYTFSEFLRENFIDKDAAKKVIDEVTVGALPNDTCEDPKTPPEEGDPGWDKVLDSVSVYLEMFYYMKLIPSEFVTGDRNDFLAKEIKERYPVVYHMFHKVVTKDMEVLLLSPDNWYRGESTLNPDGTLTPKDIPEDVKLGWNIYMLGNRDTDNLDPHVPEEDEYWKGD